MSILFYYFNPCSRTSALCLVYNNYKTCSKLLLLHNFILILTSSTKWRCFVYVQWKVATDKRCYVCVNHMIFT